MNESKIKTNPFKSTRKKIADNDSGMNMFSNFSSKQFDRKQGGESYGKQKYENYSISDIKKFMIEINQKKDENVEEKFKNQLLEFKNICKQEYHDKFDLMKNKNWFK